MPVQFVHLGSPTSRPVLVRLWANMRGFVCSNYASNSVRLGYNLVTWRSKEVVNDQT